MSNKVKDIDKKIRTYCFFHIINIKNFDPNNITSLTDCHLVVLIFSLYYL